MVMAADRYTTVRVRKETREEIERLKVHPRATVDEVLTAAFAALKRERDAARDTRPDRRAS